MKKNNILLLALGLFVLPHLSFAEEVKLEVYFDVGECVTDNCKFTELREKISVPLKVVEELPEGKLLEGHWTKSVVKRGIKYDLDLILRKADGSGSFVYGIHGEWKSEKTSPRNFDINLNFNQKIQSMYAFSMEGVEQHVGNVDLKPQLMVNPIEE